MSINTSPDSIANTQFYSAAYETTTEAPAKLHKSSDRRVTFSDKNTYITIDNREDLSEELEASHARVNQVFQDVSKMIAEHAATNNISYEESLAFFIPIIEAQRKARSTEKGNSPH